MKLTDLRHIGRIKDIAVVLMRYGFDDIVHHFDLPGSVILNAVNPIKEDLTTPERLRRVCEELGPTFVKLGQMLSLRPDLVDEEVIAELTRLQDEVPPADATAIRERVATELEVPLEDVFAEFDDVPIAAASLAQVHRARLRESGEPVAVKVQRPGIVDTIESDIAILEILAEHLQQHADIAALYDLPQVVAEFKRTTLRELDYRREARSMRIFAAHFAEHEWFHVPAVHEPHSGERLLVMELVHGTRPDRLPADRDARTAVARHGLQMICQQVLEDGFFHADPHPGNLLVLDDGRLCLLDCGMVGRLSEDMRLQIALLLKAAVDKDGARFSEALLDLAEQQGEIDEERFLLDVLDRLDAYHSLPLRELDLGRFLLDVTDLLRDYHLRLPQNLAMMVRALVTAEGVARQLDPQLDVIAEVEPILARLQRDRWHPSTLAARMQESARRFWAMNRRLPRRLGHIVDKLEHDRFAINFQHRNLENLQQTVGDAANRVTVAVIIAAIVVGSSIIIATGAGPTLFGLPALGLLGFVLSAVMGLWVVFSILRSRRW